MSRATKELKSWYSSLSNYFGLCCTNIHKFKHFDFFFHPDYPVSQPRILEDGVYLFSNMILKRVTSLNLITPRKVKENPAAMVINLRQMNVYKLVDWTKCCRRWLRGAMVARLTPDQKAACSTHVGVMVCFHFFPPFVLKNIFILAESSVYLVFTAVDLYCFFPSCFSTLCPFLQIKLLLGVKQNKVKQREANF